jgi:hypothetical protein
MAIAKLDPMPRNDFGHKVVSWQKRHADGKDLRRTVPQESHAGKMISFRCAWDAWARRRSPSFGVRPA